MEIATNRFYICEWVSTLQFGFSLRFRVIKRIIGLIGGREMITHIRMKNFKSWQDSDIVKLAPLTGFFGTNSSGKSSLLQMLLLLKQTIGKDEILFFGDENSPVNLGNFREVIHGHKDEELLELEFGCKLKKPYSTDLSTEGQQLWQSTIDHFTFKTIVQELNERPTVEFVQYVDSAGIWKIVWERDSTEEQASVGDHFVNEDHAGHVWLQNCYGKPARVLLGIEADSKSLEQVSSAFEVLFSHVYYLGPTRVQPKRSYHWEGEDPESVGQGGEDMIDSLLNARVNQTTTPYEGENVPIEERISAWLQEMDLAYSFSIKRSSTRGIETMMSSFKKALTSLRYH